MAENSGKFQVLVQNQDKTEEWIDIKNVTSRSEVKRIICQKYGDIKILQILNQSNIKKS